MGDEEWRPMALGARLPVISYTPRTGDVNDRVRRLPSVFDLECHYNGEDDDGMDLEMDAIPEKEEEHERMAMGG